MNGYVMTGLSAKKVTEEQQGILCAPIDPVDVEVKPVSHLQVYLSHGKYRERLNRAFGVGGWGMEAVGEPEERSGYLMQKWALWVEGRCLDVSRGAQRMGEEDEKGMAWDDAEEAAKSNALVRCCKTIGMALECWDRKWIAWFRDTHCVKVWVEGQRQPLWRRKDDPPLYKETGSVGGARPAAPVLAPPVVDKEYPQPVKEKKVPVPGNGEGYISVIQQQELFAALKEGGKRTLSEFRLLLTENKLQGTGSIPVGDFQKYLAWMKGALFPAPSGMDQLQEVAKKLGKSLQDIAEEWGYPSPERLPPDVIVEIVGSAG